MVFPTFNDVFLSPKDFAQAKQSHTFLSYFSSDSNINKYLVSEFFQRMGTYLSPNYLVIPGQLTSNTQPENIYVFANISNANDNKWITEKISPFGPISVLFYFALLVVLFNVIRKLRNGGDFKNEIVFIGLFLAYIATSVIPNYGNPSLSKTGPANLLILIGILYILDYVWQCKFDPRILTQRIAYSVLNVFVVLMVLINAYFGFSYINSFAYTKNEADKFDYGYREIAEDIYNQKLLAGHPIILFKDNLWSKEKHLEYYLGPYILNSVVQMGGSESIDKNIIQPAKNYLLITKYSTDREDIKKLGLPYTWKEYRIGADQQKVLYFAAIGNFPITNNNFELQKGTLTTVLGNYDQYRQISDYNLAPNDYLPPQLELAKSHPDLVGVKYLSKSFTDEAKTLQPMFDFQNSTRDINLVRSSVEVDNNLYTNPNTRLWRANLNISFDIGLSQKSNCEFVIEFNKNTVQLNDKSLFDDQKSENNILLNKDECANQKSLILVVGEKFIGWNELLNKRQVVDFDTTKYTFDQIGLYTSKLTKTIPVTDNGQSQVVSCALDNETPDFKSDTIKDTDLNQSALRVQTILGTGCIKQNLNLSTKNVDLYLVQSSYKTADDQPTRFTAQPEKSETNYIDYIANPQNPDTLINQQFILPTGNYRYLQYIVEGATRSFYDTSIFDLIKTNSLKLSFQKFDIKPYSDLGPITDYGSKLNTQTLFNQNLVNIGQDKVTFSDCTPYISNSGFSRGGVEGNEIILESDQKASCAKMRVYNLSDGTYSVSFEYQTKGNYSPNICILDLKSYQCLPTKIVASNIKSNNYQSFFKVQGTPQVQILMNSFSGGNFFDTPTSIRIKNLSLVKSKDDFLNNYFVADYDLNETKTENQALNYSVDKITGLNPSYTIKVSTDSKDLSILSSVVYDPHWSLEINSISLKPGILNNSYLGWSLNLDDLVAKKVINKSQDDKYNFEAVIKYNY